MNLKGRRIYITGSVDRESDEGKLNTIHAIVRELTITLATEGAVFTVPFGDEPLLKGRTAGPSIIFDWTVIATLHDLLKNEKITAANPNGRLIATISVNKNGQTDPKIPDYRRDMCEELRTAGAITREVLPEGWTAGAIRRQNLARLSDIMIGISGGQGVEHSAIEFSIHGKPVIPLDVNMDSSSRDGSGGSSRLFSKALTKPDDFFTVVPSANAADLLDGTRTENGKKDPAKVVLGIVNLLKALTPPRVFYVRLMDPTAAEANHVEEFFRNTVDKVVKELGFEPYQVNIANVTKPWINQAIFDDLHHSAVIVADFTESRPNCFVEMGYAFGNAQRVILSARKGTNNPFDIKPIETFFWDENDDPTEQVKNFRIHWERNIDMPRLVTPRHAK